ncbi:Uncharacterised protein [Klebsiella pneumoniae]|nr:Uncharacterised protein [Klebsiella pneumoniae]
MSNSVSVLALSTEQKQYVGDFLDCIVGSLDLSETQYSLIKRAYESVGLILLGETILSSLERRFILKGVLD